MADAPTLIEPVLVEATLIDAFPGVEMYKGNAIGRRIVFKLEFSEFALTVTTPEHSGMKGQTTLMFSRKILFKPEDSRARETSVQVFRVQETFGVDEGEALLAKIRWARGYVMGVVMALQQAFRENLGSPIANLFD